MQRTPRNRSDMARFSRNTFVIVRILLFCTSVRITSEFPITASRKIIAYIGICTLPISPKLVVVATGVAIVDPILLLMITEEAEEDDDEGAAAVSTSAVIARIILMDTLCANESREDRRGVDAEEVYDPDANLGSTDGDASEGAAGDAGTSECKKSIAVGSRSAAN